MQTQRYGKRSSIIYRWLIDPLVQPLRPRIVSLCLKHNVRHVLDIGCATGEQCRQLGAARITAVGVDLSEDMIAAANSRAHDRVEYVVGSAFELPFESGRFDAALLSLALHEHPETERATMIREALRVVGSGGYLIIAEYSKPMRPYMHLPWGVIQLVEKLAGQEHHDGFRGFIAADGLAGLLKRHNLSPIDVVTSHFHTLSAALVQVEE